MPASSADVGPLASRIDMMRAPRELVQPFRVEPKYDFSVPSRPGQHQAVAAGDPLRYDDNQTHFASNRNGWTTFHRCLSIKAMLAGRARQ